MAEFYIAQINIALMLAPIDDPLMADFVARLPPINALADESPGFVWRLQSDSGDATSIKVYDDMIIINLTVWESVEALREYVYKSAHSSVMRDRRRWFEKLAGPDYALYAFSFKHIFPKPVGSKREPPFAAAVHG